ncbi:MAG TPA: SDR family oxidoreductase [Bryobacteraceae bacterium]|jgi:uncharacterized protein YbjT (DUF2867 family)|nr:SDR family oxidoreductase [Bryobacteraceae bacterium]
MILITGAGGNVGREVLKQMVQTRTAVRAAYQSAAKAVAPPGVEIATIDYNRPDTVRAALTGVTRVFLVGPPTAELSALDRKAIDVIAQAQPVPQVVKLSAKGGRGALFPRLHAESEDYIASSGVPYTFLRPNGFMQNIVNYSGTTIQDQNAFFGSEGDGKVSIIDIRDVAAVALKALTEDTHIGKAYTLTGPDALTNTEVAKVLSDVLGREIRFINLPPAQLKQGLLGAGVKEWSADALLDLQRFYREGNAATVTNDVERVLGRKPIRFAQFAAEYRSAFETRAQAGS